MSINPELQQKLRDYIKNACNGSQNQKERWVLFQLALYIVCLDYDFQTSLLRVLCRHEVWGRFPFHSLYFDF